MQEFFVQHHNCFEQLTPLVCGEWATDEKNDLRLFLLGFSFVLGGWFCLVGGA